MLPDAVCLPLHKSAESKPMMAGHEAKFVNES